MISEGMLDQLERRELERAATEASRLRAAIEAHRREYRITGFHAATSADAALWRALEDGKR